MLNPTPTNDTTVRPFHVRTGNSGVILSWCDDTQKFSPFAVLVMAVEGVCFNFQFRLSISVWVVNLCCFWFLWFRSYQCATNLRSAIVDVIGCYQLISVSIINFICASNHQKLFSSFRFREVLLVCSCSFNYLSSTNKCCWFPTTVVGIILWMKVWILL